MGAVRAFDDLEGPSPDPLQGGFEFGAGISAVGEDMAQPREAVPDGGEQGGRAVAILDVGGVDPGGYQQAAGVGEDMTLARTP